MTYAKIRLSVEDEVALITLNDPATLNAAGTEMARELADAFDRANSGALNTRAVILTGEGRGFCSGANLTATSGETAADEPRDPGASLKTVYNPLFTQLRDLDVPLVTAVNGAAAGVGCSLALMGDIILASESAYFLQAFRRIGLVPDGGSTYLLPRLIGKARAMEMALLGEKLPAAKALDWGLINRVVPEADLMPAAFELARELARGPRSVGMIRRLMLTALDADWAEALETEADTQTMAGRTDDFREGVAAFLQKRPARFQGR